MIVACWSKRLCFELGTAHMCRMVRLPRRSNEMGAKTDPKSVRGGRVHPFQLFRFLAQWISIYQTLSGSFHVFPVKHGVSCNLFTDWLVKSENFFGVRGSQCRCDFREKRGSPRVDRLVFICFTWPWGVGPPSWRQTHVLGHSSFWAACASGFKGRHQAIPYADGGIMVY